MDYSELLSPVRTCPLGCVEAILHGSPSHGETLLVARPNEALQAVVPRLSKVRAWCGCDCVSECLRVCACACVRARAKAFHSCA
jgi:hypothetical protein